MKIQLQGLSNRSDHDGWAVFYKGAKQPIEGTICTTRKEARQLRVKQHAQMDMFAVLVVDKVKVKMEVSRT